MLRSLALFAIRLYQRYLSPRKGFSCAYRLVYGGCGCSGVGYRLIRRYGVFSGCRLLRLRLAHCRFAYTHYCAPAQPSARAANRATQPVNRVNGMAYYQRGDCVPCDAGCLDVGGCDSCDLGAPDACHCDAPDACDCAHVKSHACGALGDCADACHCDTKSRACDTLGDYANACPCDACDAMDCGRKEEEREPKKKPIRMPNLR